MLQGDSYREVFAHRGFRHLWLGQSLAFLGRAISHVAVALYVYELTGSAGALSFAIALELLPWVLIGPAAGMLADRLDRKRILIAAYLVQAGLVLLLPFTTNLGQLFALVFLSNLLSPVAEIVRAAALPAVTGQQLFVRGSSLDIVAYNAANVFGPPLGGWLTSVVGPQPTFVVVVGCLIGAALLTTRITVPGPRKEHLRALGRRVIWADLLEGTRFLLRHPLLRYLLLLNCISSLGWSAPDLASVVYVTDVLGLGGREYGLLRGTISLSIALGVYLLGRYSRELPQGRLLVGGVVTAGLAYAAVLLKPGMGLLLGLWFTSGVGWAANWLTDNALWARATPDGVRGRVYSLAEATVHLAEVGTALLGGWLISALGPVHALFIIGAAIALGSIALSALMGGYKTVARFDAVGSQPTAAE